MPRFNHINFIKIDLKLGYFCLKNSKFLSVEGSAQAPTPRATGALLPDPCNQTWARSPLFGDFEDQDQIIQKCDLQDQIIKIM